MTRDVTIASYALIGAAIAAYELAGVVWSRTPRLGDVAAWLTRSRAGRIVVLAVWLWVGWHLFVRSDWGH